MSVAVVGAGAIGVLVAAELQAAGADVVVGARRPFERLVVEGRHDLPATVITEPEGAVDWLIVTMKAQDSPAGRDWADVMGGQVVAVQNGIEHRSNLGQDALPAVITAATERVGEGRVVHRFGHSLVVPEGAAAEGYADLFADTMFDVDLVEDFRTAAWEKLLRNAVANPITALTGRRMGIFRDDGLRTFAGELLRETLAVAQADGARLGEDNVDRILGMFAGMPEDSGTSMLYDREAGRPLEYDALTGAVVRAGERLSIDVPLNRAVLALVRMLST